MPSVLIIEDERDLATLVQLNLRAAGLDVHVVHSAGEGWAALTQAAPDLVVLDVMLPDLPGLELLRRLRAAPGLQTTPVLLLTARDGEEDRVAGLEAGADDYVVKPFSVRELVLRAAAILRRGRAALETHRLESGTVSLDPATHRCTVDGSDVELTALEFRFLYFLMARPGRVQTREWLLSEVWGLRSSIETRTIDTHVMRLREKLGRARDCVETVRGVGYRFVAPGQD